MACSFLFKVDLNEWIIYFIIFLFILYKLYILFKLQANKTFTT